MVHLALVVDLSLPVTTAPQRLKELYQQRHLPLLQELLKWPRSALTLCINSWLLQHWLDQGWEAGLQALRELYDFGKVELCGTASHHAILPLVPESVAFRQVRRNVRLLQQLLHPEWRPSGFAPPQLGFGHELARVLQPLGFNWCLADDSAYAALHGNVPGEHILRCAGMSVLLCSRLWSERLQHLGNFSVARFAHNHHQELKDWLQPGGRGYQVLRLPGEAADAATLRKFVETHQELGNHWLHASQLFDHFPSLEGDVPPGSCSTSVEEFWNGNFFSPWQSQGPAWQLSQQAILGLESVQDKLDELLTSTTFSAATAEQVESLRRLVEWCGGLQV
ncbi:MAG: hypothetical protein U0931_09710 [Vulcanimicrobiota bacterium]